MNNQTDERTFTRKCKCECWSCDFRTLYFPEAKFPFVCCNPDGIFTQLESEPYCGSKFIPPIGKKLIECDLL